MSVNNKRGMIWDREHNDYLRKWVAEGLTVKAICEMAEETFEMTFTDAQIRAHLKFIGLTPARARKERKAMFTPAMREWVYDHREIPPTYLVRLFRTKFGDAGREIQPRYVNGLAAKSRIDALAYRTEAEIAAEWERVRMRISPEGNIAREHWLWRYKPIDDTRSGSGVRFRE